MEKLASGLIDLISLSGLIAGLCGLVYAVGVASFIIYEVSIWTMGVALGSINLYSIYKLKKERAVMGEVKNTLEEALELVCVANDGYCVEWFDEGLDVGYQLEPIKSDIKSIYNSDIFHILNYSDVANSIKQGVPFNKEMRGTCVLDEATGEITITTEVLD